MDIMFVKLHKERQRTGYKALCQNKSTVNIMDSITIYYYFPKFSRNFFTFLVEFIFVTINTRHYSLIAIFAVITGYTGAPFNVFHCVLIIRLEKPASVLI